MNKNNLWSKLRRALLGGHKPKPEEPPKPPPVPTTKAQKGASPHSATAQTSPKEAPPQAAKPTPAANKPDPIQFSGWSFHFAAGANDRTSPAAKSPSAAAQTDTPLPAPLLTAPTQTAAPAPAPLSTATDRQATLEVRAVGGERVVRVFVSSTFRDMVEDRNELMAHIWPALRTLCRGTAVEFVEVDLRWGVTEEMIERQELLRHCLAEIKRCRPYFIGLLGERYGSLLRPNAIASRML